MTNFGSGLAHQIAPGQWKTVYGRDIEVYLSCISLSCLHVLKNHNIT